MDGCDRAMQQLAGAGASDCFDQGVASNPWLLLLPAIEVQALAIRVG
jgi:hypothetical protein